MSNTKNLLVAQKYANALAELNLSEEIVTELESLASAYNDNPEFKSFLENPSIQKDLKIATIKKIFSNNLNQNLLSMVMLLLERRRINLLSVLKDSYKEIYNNRNNIQDAELTTAKEINNEELNSIKDRLEQLFNKSINLSTNVDDSLIAGFKVKTKNKVIDSSLSKKLKNFKNLMSI